MRLIDAEKLKEFLKPHDMWKKDYPHLTWEEIWEQECEDIDAQPTIDSVKHGKWIHPEAADCYKCSVCEEYTLMEMSRLLYHYCPNCGAKMDEVTE